VRWYHLSPPPFLSKEKRQASRTLRSLDHDGKANFLGRRDGLFHVIDTSAAIDVVGDNQQLVGLAVAAIYLQVRAAPRQGGYIGGLGDNRGANFISQRAGGEMGDGKRREG
jgi:hypothetical protein